MKLIFGFFKLAVVALVLGAALYGARMILREAAETRFSPPPKPSRDRILMSMHGFKFVQTEKERVSWRMTARSADLYENKEAMVKHIEIVFFGSDNRETVLRGESATVDTLSGNAVIRRGARDVRIVTSMGYLLTTDSLSWDAGERIVKTKAPFKLLGNEVYLEGEGLIANAEMGSIEVRHRVKAVLQE
jgi:LPS export ABC transporter protein LptC